MSDETGAASQSLDRDEDLDSRPELPPADFDFLVYSLRLQTELNLGLLPSGEFGEDGEGKEGNESNDAPDFELARHNIDLLAMLQLKTKGNLTPEEQRALDTSITELRFRFVQVKAEVSSPA
jgi:hypothetical protein